MHTANAAPPHIQETTGESLNEFEHVTEDEVIKLIAFAPNKQSSLDPFEVKYLKKVSSDVACSFAHIFNRSFENGYVPNKFKNAVLTSHLKKAELDVDDPSNFRPISNVSLTSNILERLVWSRLDVHLDRIGTIPSVQSAYRRNRSTKTAHAKVSSDIIMVAEVVCRCWCY